MSDPLISVKIDNTRAIEAFLRFPEAFERAVDPQLSRGAEEVARIARSLAPKAFSTLANAINARKAGPLHYEVVAGVNYARPVEEGVKGPMDKQPGTANGLEEWIRLRTGETDPAMLRRRAFGLARMLKTKGIAAHPYMAPAAEQGASRVAELVAAGVVQGVKEIFG